MQLTCRHLPTTEEYNHSDKKKNLTGAAAEHHDHHWHLPRIFHSHHEATQPRGKGLVQAHDEHENEGQTIRSMTSIHEHHSENTPKAMGGDSHADDLDSGPLGIAGAAHE